MSGEVITSERDGHYIAGPKTVNLAHRSDTIEVNDSQDAQSRSPFQPLTEAPKRSLSFTQREADPEPVTPKEPELPSPKDAPVPVPKAKRQKTTYDKYYHQIFGCNFISHVLC